MTRNLFEKCHCGCYSKNIFRGTKIKTEVTFRSQLQASTQEIIVVFSRMATVEVKITRELMNIF